MRKWDESFFHDWKLGDDSLTFHVAINRLPENVRKYGEYQFMADAMYKIGKSEDVTISAEEIQEEEAEAAEEFPTKNREKSRKKHHKEVAAKNRRQALAKYSDDYIMPNSGKVKNTGFRSYEKGAKVYKRNKNIPVESTLSPFNPLDGDFLDFNPDTIDSYETEEADGRLWEKADKIAASEDDLWERFEEELEKDSALLEENLKNWEWEEPSESFEISNLKKQIAIYKDFIGTYNLNKLFDTFCESNGII